jgi:TatD DNase family protein
MTRLFDAHAHLTDEAFAGDREEIIGAMQRENIWALNCGTDVRSSYLCTVLAERHAFLYAAVGMHPHDAKDYTDEAEAQFIAWLAEEKTVAIGEIGLDYYYDYSPRDVQRDVFARQIHIANTYGVPVVVHAREAAQDTYDIIKGEMKTPRAVLHSFSQSREMLHKYLDMDVMFSISGPVTYANADRLRETVAGIPMERLLIETDCPY